MSIKDIQFELADTFVVEDELMEKLKAIELQAKHAHEDLYAQYSPIISQRGNEEYSTKAQAITDRRISLQHPVLYQLNQTLTKRIVLENQLINAEYGSIQH